MAEGLNQSNTTSVTIKPVHNGVLDIQLFLQQESALAYACHSCGHIPKKCMTDKQHRPFCEPCSKPFIENGEKMTHSPFADQMISKLELKCNNKLYEPDAAPNQEEQKQQETPVPAESECEWIGSVKEWQSHTDNDCIFAIKQCIYCETYHCSKCLMAKHDAVCPEKPILCDQECCGYVVRKDIESHKLDDCPKSLVKCRNDGCKQKMMTENLQRHETQECPQRMGYKHIRHYKQTKYKHRNRDTMPSQRKQLDFQRLSQLQQILQIQLHDITTKSERQREQFEQREKRIHDQLNEEIQKLKAENIQNKQEYNKKMEQIKQQSDIRLNDLETKRDAEKKEYELKIKQLKEQNAKEIKKLSNENLKIRLDSTQQIIIGALARYQDKKDQVKATYNIYRNDLIQISKEERRLKCFSEEINDPNLLNVVLLGPTGHGKSALACRLAGDTTEQCDGGYFEHNDNLVSVTQGITKRVAKGIWQKDLSVTDTPGIFDSGGKDRDHANNLIEFLRGCGGVNAFILVKTQVPPRFDESFQNVLDTLQVLLGGDFWKYCIICITHFDRYESKSQKFQDYAKKLQLSVRQKIHKTESEAPLPCFGVDSISNWKNPIQDLIKVIRRDRFNCDNLRSPLQELKLKTKATQKEFENKKNELNGIKEIIDTAYQQYQHCDQSLQKNDEHYMPQSVDLSLIENESKDEWNIDDITISDDDDDHKSENDIISNDEDDQKIAEQNDKYFQPEIPNDGDGSIWREIKTETKKFRLKQFNVEDEVSIDLEDIDCNPAQEIIKLDKTDNRYASFKYIIEKAEEEGDDCMVTVQYTYFDNDHGEIQITTKVERVEVGDFDDEAYNIQQSNKYGDDDEYKLWFANILKLPQYYDKFIEKGYERFDHLFFADEIEGDELMNDVGIFNEYHRRKILSEIQKITKEPELRSPEQSIKAEPIGTEELTKEHMEDTRNSHFTESTGTREMIDVPCCDINDEIDHDSNCSLIDEAEQILLNALENWTVAYCQFIKLKKQLHLHNTNGIIKCPIGTGDDSDASSTNNTGSNRNPHKSESDNNEFNQRKNKENENDEGKDNNDRGEAPNGNNKSINSIYQETCNHLSTCDQCANIFWNKSKEIELYHKMMQNLEQQQQHHKSFALAMDNIIQNCGNGNSHCKSPHKSKSKKRRPKRKKQSLNVDSYDPNTSQRAKNNIKIPRVLTEQTIPRTVSQRLYNGFVYEYLDKTIAMQYHDAQHKVNDGDEKCNDKIVNTDLNCNETGECLYCIIKRNKPNKDKVYKSVMENALFIASDPKLSGYKLPESSRDQSQAEEIERKISDEIQKPESINKMLKECDWKDIQIFDSGKKQKVVLHISSQELKERIQIQTCKFKRNYGTKLIPIVMFSNGPYWIEYIVPIDLFKNDCFLGSIGISLKYDEDKGVNINGIHLDWHAIKHQHHLAMPNHINQCQCITDCQLQSMLDSLYIGNPEEMTNKIKDCANRLLKRVLDKVQYTVEQYFDNLNIEKSAVSDKRDSFEDNMKDIVSKESYQKPQIQQSNNYCNII